jgi:uncharacterized membrane protein YdbT with pleckstrin-like domain
MQTHHDKPVLWQSRPSHIIQIPKYLALLVLSAALAGGGAYLPAHYEGNDLHGSVLAAMDILPVICFSLAAILGVWLLYTFINHHYTRYTLTDDTLYTRTSFLRGEHDTLWVHLIRDVRAELPLFLRILGLGNVVVMSRDQSHPELVLQGIRQARDIKSNLNDIARMQAARHRVVSVGE